jgi:ubiquinone/menaquinone biosynthesis C-methylase UbiE
VPYLRERAEQGARRAAVSVTVVDGLGGALPFEDASFDTGVVSLVLCSVPDQGPVLSDLFRVVRASGELRFYEHVRANRDTAAAIEAAGFSIESCQTVIFSPCFVCAPAARRIIGTARRPGASAQTAAG